MKALVPEPGGNRTESDAGRQELSARNNPVLAVRYRGNDRIASASGRVDQTDIHNQPNLAPLRESRQLAIECVHSVSNPRA
jgi:hypothetical protein